MRGLSALSLPLVVVLAAGCERTGSLGVGPGVDLSAKRSAVAKTAPFASQGYSFHTTAAAPEAGCDAAGENRLYLSGDGRATHLGRFTVAFSFCSRPNGTLADGRGTFTAANGDLLRFSFDGVSAFVPPFTVNFTSFATFRGGTGRFENASGHAVVNGTVDARTGYGDGEWEGTISTVGSSNR